MGEVKPKKVYTKTETQKAKEARRAEFNAATFSQKKNPKTQYARKNPVFDYLKYWKIVRYWAGRKYNLNSRELDLVLYLNSNGLFTVQGKKAFKEMFGFRGKALEGLFEKGYVQVWRQGGTGREATLYDITDKTRKLCDTIYAILQGEEVLSELPTVNPLFTKNATYADRLHARAITRMNKEIKESKLHLVPRSF